MSKRADYLEAITNLVPGEYTPGDAGKILAVGEAVKTYSKHRPHVLTEDVSGADEFDYVITSSESPPLAGSLTYWSDGFSVINKVEYPVDDEERADNTLQEDEWTLYNKPLGQYLRFIEEKPASGEFFRVTYTALHTCDDTISTIKVIDEEAVQSLAAAFYCEMLATYFAQNQDSTIQADVVNHTSKSRDFAARAKAYRQFYYDHMGIKEGTPKAASVTRDQDLTGSSGRDKITHPRKYR